MAKIKFIYFEGCPNAEKVRQNLQAAGAEFDEVKQDDLPEGHTLKKYSSPTVLKDGQPLFGIDTASQGGGCSLEVPTTEQIRDKLEASNSGKGGWFASVGSFGSVITVGLCPICIPAIGAFLSAIGLGFLVNEAVLKPVLIVFLLATIAGLAWSYFREHKKIAPLLLGILLAVGLYAGRYFYFGSSVNEILEFGSMGGLIAVSIWNLSLRKTAGCVPCTNIHARGK